MTEREREREREIKRTKRRVRLGLIGTERGNTH